MLPKRMLIFACSIVAIVFCMVVAIPFEVSNVTIFELDFKFVFALIACGILVLPALLDYIICKKQNDDMIRCCFCIPLITYIISTCIFLMSLVIRNHQIASFLEFVRDQYQWVVLLIIISAFIIALFVMIFFPKLFKHQSLGITIFLDVILVGIAVTLAILTRLLAKNNLDETYTTRNDIVMVLTSSIAIITSAIGCIFVLVGCDNMNNLYYIQREIDEENIDTEEEALRVCYKYSKERLEDLGKPPYDYKEKEVVVDDTRLKEELEKKDEELKEKEEKINELSKEIYSKDEEIASLDEELAQTNNDLENTKLEKEELLKQIEALTKEEEKVDVNLNAVIAPVVSVEEEKPVKIKEPKEFNPSAKQILQFIQKSFNDCLIVVSDDNESFKVFRNKKLLLVFSQTANDQRITFQRKPISITRLIVKYPSITKAKSPVGEQWFKLINKGEFSEADLFNIITASYNYLIDEEKKKQELKEKQAMKKKLALQKKRDAIKKKKQAEKEKQKLRLKKEKEKEKERLEKEEARNRKLAQKASQNANVDNVQESEQTQQAE